MCICADLGEDVLFPHEFLPLSVGCRGNHRQNILAVVWHHTHKENQVLQELGHKPLIQTKVPSETSTSEFISECRVAWRRVSVPSLVLNDVGRLELPHGGLQHLTGIVGKVQVSDLRQRHRHDGERFFVLFSGTGANLW